jgi:putative phage-type endonuclease
VNNPTELTSKTQDRSSFIGGSDIAGILGLSRWKTPLAIWAEKTGQITPREGPEELHKKLGNRLEEVVAELFTEKTGLRVQRAAERRVHPKYPHFQAQIDRIVVGTDDLLECKTTSPFNRKEWAEDEMPQEYICQCMWQLAVTGRKKAYLAVLIGNTDFKVKEIDRDPVLIAEMLKRANAFWDDFVIPRVMPAQITAADADAIYALFPESEPNTHVDLGDDVAKLIESRNAFYQDKIQIEKQIEQAENEIKVKMGTNEAAQAGKWIVSWKSQVSKRLDTALLKNNEPELYKKYSKESPSRVFRIKEIKGDGASV